MKKIFSVFTLILLSSALIGLEGCKNDEDPAIESEIERVARLLTTGGAWNIQSVKVDGIDQTSIYSGFSLTFSNSGFTSNKGEPIWPSTGSWAFADETATTINRVDGLTVTIKNIAENSLILTLIWDKATLGPGRVGSVKGVHEFEFEK